MKTLQALGCGLVGASVLTLLHETARRVNPDAPRMDLLGMRAIAKAMRAVDQIPPDRKTLHTASLVGDVISNSLYYSLVAVGNSRNAWLRGSLLGVGAGIGGVVLPGPLGLGEKPSGRTLATKAMTVTWYLVGGLAAAAATRTIATGKK